MTSPTFDAANSVLDRVQILADAQEKVENAAKEREAREKNLRVSCNHLARHIAMWSKASVERITGYPRPFNKDERLKVMLEDGNLYMYLGVGNETIVRTWDFAELQKQSRGT